MPLMMAVAGIVVRVGDVDNTFKDDPTINDFSLSFSTRVCRHKARAANRQKCGQEAEDE